MNARFSAGLLFIALSFVTTTSQAQRGAARAAATPAPAKGSPRAARPAPTPRGEQAFRVARFNPQGGARIGDPIYAQFSADVVSTDTLRTTTTAEALIAFDPAVEGYFEWENTRRVRFFPRTGLKRGTRYTARVSPTVTSLAGQKLTGTTEFKFSTPRLALEEIEQVGFTPDRRAILRLRFSDEILPIDLNKHLSLSSGDEVVGWSITKQEKSFRPEIQTDPLTTESLVMHMSPGLKGVSGPLAMDRPLDRQVPLTFRLAPEKLNSRWKQDRASLVLNFSSPVRMEEIKKYVSVTPQVDFEAMAEGNDVLLMGEFKAEQRYTVHVKQGLRGTGGQLLLRDVPISTWVPPMRAFIELKEAGGHLSSEGQMQLRVRSSGVDSFKVKATRLYDNNLVNYLNQGDYGYGYGVRSLGRELASKEFKVGGGAKSVATTIVPLRELLTSQPIGLYYIQASAPNPGQGDNVASEHEDSSDDDGSYSSYDYDYLTGGVLISDGSVITVSNLGIVGKKSDVGLSVWVGRLNDAKPVAGAKVRAFSSKNQVVGEGTTDDKGFVSLEVDPASDEPPQVVLAEANGDVCHLRLSEVVSFDDELAEQEEISNARQFRRQGYEAFFSPERGVYRPGELVHLFGFVRKADGEVPPPFPLELQVQRPDGKLWEPQPVTANANGTLTVDVTTPDFAQTGLYTVHLQLAGTAERRATREKEGDVDEDDADSDDKAAREQEEVGQAQFYVEEFLPNRLKVDATAPEVRFTKEAPLAVAVKATEMFGQPAAGRSVSVVARFRAEKFKPAGFTGFTFGDTDTKYEPTKTELDDLAVDSQGETSITVPLPGHLPQSAMRAEIQVTVKDVGGRAVTSVVTRSIDPVPYYIGVKQQAETFAKAGTPALFELVGVKPDSTLVDNAELTATISRVRYNSVLKRDGGSFRYVTKRQLDVQTETSATLTGGKGSIAWTPKEAGSYLLKVANAEDETQTALPFEVSSPEWGEQPWSLEKPERLELVLDKKQYMPGEKARLVVKSPFAGTLLLTTEQDKVLSSQVIQMTANTHEVELQIDGAHAPNFYCVASVIRAVKPEEKWLPHRAIGRANVVLSSVPKRLDVQVQAPEERRPQSSLELSLSIKTTETSAPTAADVVVWAVDEGILSLTDFQTPDALTFFHAVKRLMVSTADLYSDLMPEILEKVVAKSSPGGDMRASRKRMSPIRNERTRPLSLWAGVVRANEQGNATVRLDLPQFMGRVRVMAVASNGKQFGSGSGTVYVRSPLMIKENLPRFAAPGDEFTVPFVVYNNTDTPQSASITLETSGPIELAGANGSSINTETIPARGMITVPVAMRAGDTPGAASVRFSGTMGGETYADVVNMPVRPASPSIRLASYDAIAAGSSKQLALPTTQFMQGTTTGSLVVSSLPSVHLASAFKYLVYYRYGCLEQTVSSAFPLLFAPELAEVLEKTGQSSYGTQLKVQRAIDRIFAMQLYSGMLSMWPELRSPWTWGSTYAAHFLVEAKKAGYEVPQQYLDELLNSIREQMSGDPRTPRHEGLAERAYGNYVLALAGRKSLDRMESLYQLRGELSPSARSLLACAYQASGHTAEAAELMSDSRNFITTETVRQTSGYLASPVRETAIVLSSLLETNSSAAEIPRLVARLEKLRNHQGHWGTTQDNAFAVWALSKYAKRMQTDPANFRGAIQLASGDTREFTSSGSLVLAAEEAGSSPSIKVDGTGSAYVVYEVEGVPLTAQPPVAKGIKVKRTYKDSRGRVLDPARPFQQGQLVVVDVTVEAERSLRNLVIEDLLPAGLEVENPNLKTSQQVDEEDVDEMAEDYGSDDNADGEEGDEGEGEGEEGEDAADGEDAEPNDSGTTGTASGATPLIVHRTETRDDRMVAFADYIAGDTTQKRNFQYAARAVTAGRFTLPGVQVTCMYDPEVEARTANATMQVVEKK